MVSIDNCTESFRRASLEVLQDVLEVTLSPGPVLSVDSPVAILEVAVIVGITGDVEGRVLFELSTDTAMRVSSVMNFGETFLEFDSMVRATLAELGNLIAGRAVTLINDEGGDLHISPPILMCGLGMRSSDQSPVQRFSIPTPHGEVGINLCVRAARNQTAPAAGRLNGARARA